MVHARIIYKSKDAKLDINLSFSRYNDFKIDDERLTSMVNGNEKSAMQISIWQMIKDFFRADKKSDAYQELYNILHNDDSSDKLDAFNKLKSFASQEYKEYFTK